MSSTSPSNGSSSHSSEVNSVSVESSVSSKSPVPSESSSTISPKNGPILTFAITPPPSSSTSTTASSSTFSSSSTSSSSLSSSFSSSLTISSSGVPNSSVEYSMGSQADSSTSEEALAALPFFATSSEISDASLLILRRSKVPLPRGFSQRDWILKHSNIQSIHPLIRSKGFRKYGEEEIKAHRKEEDAWMIYRGKVYDITDYFAYHPGGKKQLMRGAGRDATQLFDRIHPWINVESMLSKYCIGTYDGHQHAYTSVSKTRERTKKPKEKDEDEEDEDEEDDAHKKEGKKHSLLAP